MSSGECQMKQPSTTVNAW